MKYPVSTIFIFLLLCNNLFAQTKKELEEKRNPLQKRRKKA